jgi:hypothetical protein
VRDIPFPLEPIPRTGFVVEKKTRLAFGTTNNANTTNQRNPIREIQNQEKVSIRKIDDLARRIRIV